MTAQTLRRGLRAGRRLRRGDGHDTPGGDLHAAHEALLAQGRDATAPAATAEPQPTREPQAEKEWSAHRMASVLCVLSAFASEEPVHTLDQGQAIRDIFAARLIDGQWAVNAKGRDLLARYGLDGPIPIAVRKLQDSEAAATAT